jgi:hypothetical protein
VKTIDLGQTRVSVDELLNAAREDCVVVKATDGTTFLVSGADEFATEVELLRRNQRFLELLDSWKQDRRTVPLDEAERLLRAGSAGA